jgi:hypothetical protein
MTKRPVIILHGWSDTSDSFRNLARKISEETGRTTDHIWLGDYVSLDDDVRISDLAAALQFAWQSMDLSTEPHTQDVILHSTGGLILRAWMQIFYTQQSRMPPVQNVVMLAPANFGSPLAHKGRSVIGRVFKGSSSNKLFETGEKILKGLEMASPFSCDLAERDRFSSNAFSDGGVRCTVIVGNQGYRGIRGMVNENGSDGTVYVSTANLNSAKLNIDVERSDTGNIAISNQQKSIGQTALLVLDEYNHSDITGNEKIGTKLLAPILKGLDVSDKEFASWCNECEASNQAIHEKYYRRRDKSQHSFQNTIFHVKDDHGYDVSDYAIEFYGDFEEENDYWANVFNKDISGKTHVYGDNQSYRSFMIDVTSLQRELEDDPQPLRISLTALPNVEEAGNLVGYRSVGVNEIGHLILDVPALKEFFQPNRSLLITITLPRYQKQELLKLTPFKAV